MKDNIPFYQYRTARFIKDIERCPFVPGEKGYDEWNKKDKERLEKLEEKYCRIYDTAKRIAVNRDYSYSDIHIEEMCEFVIEMLRPR